MTTAKNKPTTFSTDNFVLSAFLLTEGCKPLSINWTNPRRATFLFKDSDVVRTLVDKFWRWEGAVEPRDFSAKQKELKNMLFSKSYVTPKGGEKECR